MGSTIEKAPYKLLQYARASGLIHAGLGLLSAGLFWGIPKPLFNTFCLVKECSSEEVDQFSDIAFYGAFAVIADALIIGSKGILAGLGDLTPSMIISIISLVVVGISLQVGVGVPQDVSPGGLNLLRFLAIVPSLIGHLINLGYATDKKINEITQQTESAVADGNTFDTASDSVAEATSCLSKISKIPVDALKGWSLFCAKSTIEIEEVEEESDSFTVAFES